MRFMWGDQGIAILGVGFGAYTVVSVVVRERDSCAVVLWFNCRGDLKVAQWCSSVWVESFIVASLS